MQLLETKLAKLVSSSNYAREIIIYANNTGYIVAVN